MLATVLDAILIKREDIMRKLELMGAENISDKLHWAPLPRGGPSWNTVAGVDGSINYKEYKGFVIYAVDAECVSIAENNLYVVAEAGDVDVLVPYWLPSERIKLYMSILELRTTLYTLENLDGLVLLDGTFSSLLVRPVPFTRPGPDIRQEIERVYIPDLIESIEPTILGVVSKALSEEIYEGFKHLNESEAQAACFYIEYIEYLTLLKSLLEKYGDRVIAIAKNSQSRRLFKFYQSDIAVLERITRGPGYIREEPISIKALKRALPIYREFFAEVVISPYYVRLADGGPVLKVEFPSVVSEAKVLDVFRTLSAISVEGYPYPLMRAHRDSLISDKDMESISRMLSVYWARTGREHL